MNVSNNFRWVRLGDYIDRSMVNNRDLKYGVELIEGVNSSGEFCSPKANTVGINLKPYKVVQNGYFVYNPSRLNIGSLAYRTDGLCIVSHLYVVFHLNDLGREKLLPEFLFIYFKRKEFLRLIDYLNFGSQRPEFNFFEMSEIQIPLPDIDTQQELVNTYNGLKALAEQNEALIEPLTQACQAYIVDCKKKYPEVELGEYIEELDERNSDGKCTLDDVKGISILKKLIPTKADMKDVSLSPYKLLKPNDFSYVTVTSRNGGKISLAINDSDKTYIVSSSYKVFRSKNAKELLPEFLFLLISKDEFDRYSRFNSWGSARETFDWIELCRVRIPLPPPEVQQSIVNLYNCAEEAKKIANKARKKMKTLCPALVQKAING
ncbi:restriction endonuclease subunit S [Arenibacter algicola]|uniref:restriction endonuclease subunit S n=1 Tax=Arenibacter algicola TaxID=616991 RepID=UPI0004DF629F|nr:restriction endonuclease subunit S [Arenibacter algicola]